MLSNHVKLIRIIFIGVLIGVFACVGMGILSKVFEEGSSQAPVRSLQVSIESNQRQELFDQLRKFSDKHDFEYSVTDYGGQGKYFLVSISGKYIKILTVEASRNLDTFSIRFYAPSPGDPLPDTQTVDDLVVDLKSYVVQIPNARVTEEQ